MNPALLPEARALLLHLAEIPPASDLAAARAGARAMVADCDLPPDRTVTSEDTSIGGGAGQPLTLRIYRPADGRSSPGPAMLFLHGGGWMVCDLETHHALCTEIARRLGMTLVSVDYRLAPEHKFPAALDDAIAACRWLAESPKAIGHRVTALILAGDSAGGNLAAGCTAIRASLPVPIIAQWLMYATLDMTASGGSLDEFDGYLLSSAGMEASREAYFADRAQRSDPRASPIGDADFASLPPSLVFACECDPLRDQSRRYAAQLARHGVPLRYREAKGQIHGCFTLRRRLPTAQRDLADCIADLRSLIALADEDVQQGLAKEAMR